MEQCKIGRRELRRNCKYPLPGLVPGIHVLATGIAKAQEDVDGRVKPDQGDLWLCMDGWRQAVSFRTAVGGRRGCPGTVLWFYEANAVLSREQNRGALAAPKAGDFIAELQALRIAADAESVARVFGDVHSLALAYRLTSYDTYLELALRRSLPLATLDDDLIRASKAAGVTVL